MSKLDDLKKKIYHPEAGKELEDRLKPQESKKGEKKKKEWKKGGRQKLSTKTIFIVSIIVAILLLGFGYYQWIKFRPKKVKVSIAGVKKTQTAKVLDYEFTVKNDNRQPIKNASLKINYPELTYSESKQAFQKSATISVGKIKPGKKKTISKKIRFLSSPHLEITTKANLNYEVDKSNFSQSTSLTTRITSSPLKVTFQKPRRLVKGQEALFRIFYSNNGNFDFPATRIKINPPPKFRIVSAKPKPDYKKTWNLGALDAGESGKIIIRGRPEEKSEEAHFNAVVESKFKKNFAFYAESSKIQKVAPPPLSISQAINKIRVWWNVDKPDPVTSKGSLEKALKLRKSIGLSPIKNISGKKLGNIYKVMLQLKNTSDTTFNNIDIQTELGGELFDPSWIIPERLGKVSKNRRKITWKKNRMTPQETDSFGFYIHTKKELPLARFEDNNLFKTTASITTPSVPPGWKGIEVGSKNLSTLKLATKAELKAKVVSRKSPLYSKGPIPPVIEKKTTYPVVWEIYNTYNDLKNTTIKAKLPPYVEWSGNYFPTDANINYNSLKNELVWKPNKISYGTGHLNEPRQVFFQIVLTPKSEHYGKTPAILQSSTLTGEDAFLNRKLKTQTGKVKTNSKVKR